MKEYSLQEVLDTERVDFKTKSGTIVYAEKGQLYIKLKIIMDEVKWICPLTKEWLETKFMKVQEPVNFMEVVSSNKKCKVEHELITDIINSDITLREFDGDTLEYKWFVEYKDKGYLQLNLLMSVIMGFLNVRDFKTVIEEGKWYLSEEEDICI
jgi:hypothetical protein